MDELDHRILKELQESFPLEKDPYSVLAHTLNIGVEELWERVSKLLETGVIRRMGFSLDSKKLGYASTLAAVRVSRDRVEDSARVISRYPQVTHSYLREHEFNIWFTVIAEDWDSVSALVEKIQAELGLPDSDVLNLPIEKLFKLDARFK